jgi:hypothetical protein
MITFCRHQVITFTALGLWIHFSDIRANAAFFLASIAVGVAIPFSLFTIEIGELVGVRGERITAIARASWKFNPYGILGGVAIILMFGFAFRWQWNINWWYFLAATILYSLAVINLAHRGRSLTIFRLLLGCHLALLILAVGLLLHFQDNRINLAFFLAGTAAGVAFPFLLIRS